MSIEWSSMYSEFSEGYYIVVIASSTERDDEIKKLLKKAQKIISSAYIKSATVWQGCLH